MPLRLIEVDGLAIAGSFRDADAARDGGLIHLVSKVFLDLLHHLQRQVIADREHGEHHALDVQIGVVLLADGLKSADKLRQTFQRIILALHRDEDAVAGAQAVQRQQVKAGRAVDEDKVVIFLDGGQRLAQAALAARQIDHLKAGTREAGVGADDVGAKLRLADSLPRVGLADENFICTNIYTPLGNTITGGGVALWVEVYDEHFFAQRRHAGREVDGCGGLAHAALLVCNSNDFCHATCFLPGKRFVPHGTFRGRSPPFSPQQVPYTA